MGLGLLLRGGLGTPTYHFGRGYEDLGNLLWITPAPRRVDRLEEWLAEYGDRFGPIDELPFMGGYIDRRRARGVVAWDRPTMLELTLEVAGPPFVTPGLSIAAGPRRTGGRRTRPAALAAG